jgi:hypothetical protein
MVQPHSRCITVVVRCHHDMASPQVADGGNSLKLHITYKDASILTKESRTVDKG